MATILLHENDARRNRRMRAGLESRGHKVWSARHLQEMIPVLGSVPVDLMIIDMDGSDPEHSLWFGRIWQGVPRLFCTQQQELVDRLNGIGGNILRKRRRVKDFLRLVERALANQAEYRGKMD